MVKLPIPDVGEPYSHSKVLKPKAADGMAVGWTVSVSRITTEDVSKKVVELRIGMKYARMARQTTMAHRQSTARPPRTMASQGVFLVGVGSMVMFFPPNEWC